MKRFSQHLALIVALGAATTLGSVVSTSIEYVDASEFGIKPSGDSDFRPTKVWGAPLPFVADHILHPNVGTLDRRDIFRPGHFLFSGILWTFAISSAYGAGLLLLSIAKGVKRHH